MAKTVDVDPLSVAKTRSGQPPASNVYSRPIPARRDVPLQRDWIPGNFHLFVRQITPPADRRLSMQRARAIA